MTIVYRKTYQQSTNQIFWSVTKFFLPWLAFIPGIGFVQCSMSFVGTEVCAGCSRRGMRSRWTSLRLCLGLYHRSPPFSGIGARDLLQRRQGPEYKSESFVFDGFLMCFKYFGVLGGCLVCKGWSREVTLWFFMVLATRMVCFRNVLGSLQGEHFSKSVINAFLQPNRFKAVQNRFPRCPPGWKIARISNFALKTVQHFKFCRKAVFFFHCFLEGDQGEGWTDFTSRLARWSCTSRPCWGSCCCRRRRRRCHRLPFVNTAQGFDEGKGSPHIQNTEIQNSYVPTFNTPHNRTSYQHPEFQKTS